MLLNTSVDAAITISDHRGTNISIVKNDVEIVNSHKNWNVLFYKKALKIKELKQILHNGLKAFKELDLS